MAGCAGNRHLCQSRLGGSTRIRRRPHPRWLSHYLAQGEEPAAAVERQGPMFMAMWVSDVSTTKFWIDAQARRERLSGCRLRTSYGAAPVTKRSGKSLAERVQGQSADDHMRTIGLASRGLCLTHRYGVQQAAHGHARTPYRQGGSTTSVGVVSAGLNAGRATRRTHHDGDDLPPFSADRGAICSADFVDVDAALGCRAAMRKYNRCGPASCEAVSSLP
jgi:hypothetical protein